MGLSIVCPLMVIVLSLLTALAFGTGDFCGGLAAKRTSTLRVVGLSHVIGFFGVFAAALVVDNVFLWRDVGLGAVGGAFGGIGIALLYRGLARGPMSVVAPVTAISSAAVPALWGLVSGERPSLLVACGLGVALVAIWMVSASDDDDGLGVGVDPGRPGESAGPVRSTTSAVLEALAAGAGFGLFFIMLDMTDPTSSPWAVVGARALTGSVLGLVVVGGLLRSGGDALNAGESAGRWDTSTLGLIGLTGVIDTAANVLFLLSLGAGSLVVVAILTSLYPIATIALATLVLNESLNRRQRVGLPLALLATVLIASG